MIDVRNLTMVYRSGKGVFDLAFSVKEGEVFGYLGPNGAGKTTCHYKNAWFKILCLIRVFSNRGNCKLSDYHCLFLMDLDTAQENLCHITSRQNRT